jgi:phenylacetate-CoA ligase
VFEESGLQMPEAKRRGNWYTKLVSGLIFPLHEHLKGHSTVRKLRFLEQSQWWSKTKLDEYRAQRLRSFLEKVGRQVPYYRRIFSDSGFTPGALTSMEDLQHLPFLTKDSIRTHLDELKAEGRRELSQFNTGGSTGSPLIFYISKERVTHDVAAKWRATRWWNVDVGDREVVVWGSPIELNVQDSVRSWRDQILRTRLLSAFEMSPRRLDDFVEIIRRVRPKMLFGYPTAISLIGKHAHAQRKSMDDLGIEVIFVTAEQLYDHLKEDIERLFGCHVANGYGGRDAGFVAHECQEGGMHISAEDIIVEIVDDEGAVVPPGQAGEITITHMATGDFPFIRYRTGDVAVLDADSCSCGRGLPLLKEIHGRTTDFIVAEDGTVMHALALIYVIRDVPGVRNFKIVQDHLREIRVVLDISSDFAQDGEERIRKGIAKRVGEGIEVTTERVHRIPPEESGKHRYVVSRVSRSILD